VSATSALSPVSVALYTALNVSALLALLQGGVNDIVPQGALRPYVFFEVSNPLQHGGFGTYPGHFDVPELELRIHSISDQENVSQGQAIVAQALALLFVPGALSVTGYTVCATQPLPDIQILNLGDQVIANVVVHEEVAIVRLIVENTGA
jgi:hypothetical protein